MSALRRAVLVGALVLAVLVLAVTPALADKPEEAPGRSRTGSEPTHGPGAGSPGQGEPGKDDKDDQAANEKDGKADDGTAGEGASSEPSADSKEGQDVPAVPDDASTASDVHPGKEKDNDRPASRDPEAAPAHDDETGPQARHAGHVAGQGSGDNGHTEGDGGDGAGESATPSADKGATPGSETGHDAATTPARIPLNDGTDRLAVHRSGREVRVAWTVPDEAQQVQLWRNDGFGWVPVAAAAESGAVADPAGQDSSQYRLTWTTRTLAGADLVAAASALPLLPALPDESPIGAALLGLLWAGIAGFATVRAPGARPVPDARVGPDNQLMPALAGLPGIDHAALDRVVGLGVRTVGQLRALDAEALAFWARIPTATVRRWHDALDLLQWVALPAGAAHRLARAGVPTLADVAAADPERLWADLRQGVVTAGPGLPADVPEVASWVAEARQLLGLRAPAAPAFATRLTAA